MDGEYQRELDPRPVDWAYQPYRHLLWNDLRREFFGGWNTCGARLVCEFTRNPFASMVERQ